jgi:Bacterial cell division membrane protein
MLQHVSIKKYSIDWKTILIYLVIVTMGWISIYSVSYNFENTASIFNWDQRAGKQLVWIITALCLGGLVQLVDYRTLTSLAYIIYGAVVLLLIFTIVAPESISPDIKGSNSWLVFGPISIQPAEFAKTSTALALASYMSVYGYKIQRWKDLFVPLLLIFIPFALIILQNETGSALVFVAFLMMLYREGMTGNILLLVLLAILLFIIVVMFGIVPLGTGGGDLGTVLSMGIIYLIQFFYTLVKYKKETLFVLAGVAIITAVGIVINIWYEINFSYFSIAITALSAFYWVVSKVFFKNKKIWVIVSVTLGSIIFSISADYIFDEVLKPHQQNRIKILLNMVQDPKKDGYNVEQAIIAIGSGGLSGKGFLNGTQTRLNYVPEQDTDFVFCTVGEEHGFVGSVVVLILYWLLLMRIITIAERQEKVFNRIYAYCVANIIFFHVLINVGMVLGIMPVIGIPLPFFSYGGSSLWGFTIMLFILLRLDASRMERR